MSEQRSVNRENFSRQQKLELVKALMERDNIRDEALRSFQVAYPHAPHSMISTAIFHIYIDGIQAALDWLVDVELFLQNPKHTLSDGATFHLIYHLYNWLQFRALLPDSNENVSEKIDDIESAIKDNDIEAALELLDRLKKQFDGSMDFPNFLTP